MLTIICGALWIFAAWAACTLGVMACARVAERPALLLLVLPAAAAGTYAAARLASRAERAEGVEADVASALIAFPLLFDAILALSMLAWAIYGLGRLCALAASRWR